MRHARTNAFTLVELMVVIGIFAALASVLLPTFNSIFIMGKQTTCRNNLSVLGRGISTYSSNNRGYLPSFNDQNPSTATVGANPDSNDYVVYSDGGNTRQWYRLVLYQFVMADAFACPADDKVAQKMTGLLTHYDFPTTNRYPISYSFAVTKYFQDPTTGSVKGTPLLNTSPPEIAVVADHNGATSPWTQTGGLWTSPPDNSNFTRNSPNHDRRGQNVYFLNGSAIWADTPNCACNGDNIWTAKDNSGGTGGYSEGVDGVYPYQELTGETHDSYLRP